MKNNHKLLLVDDDPRQSGPYVEGLRDEGFEVVVVDNSDEAIWHINSSKYDVIVLDLLMPPGTAFSQEESAAGTITGWLLARRARRAQPRTLVVILTAAHSADVGEWCAKQKPPVLFFNKAAILYDEFAQTIRGSLEENFDPDLEEILGLLRRFHVVSRQLARRHDNREAHLVRDEYDVQDLLHALLKTRFDDVRPEEWVPSYGGGTSRMDFLLKERSIAIEVKKPRQGLPTSKVGEQLIVDIARYRSHPSCRTLVCFVYDPEGIIENHAGLKSDLEQLSSSELQVYIEICPVSL